MRSPFPRYVPYVATCDTHGSLLTVVEKNLWTLFVICHPWLLNVLFPLPVVILDSLSRQGSFKEHQSHHPSSSPVGLPLALQGRPSAHMFSGSLAGSPVLVCGADCGNLPVPRYIYLGFTFVPEEVKHAEKQSWNLAR